MSGNRVVVRSEMTGMVLEVLVSVGDAVGAGQELLLIESMKMEMSVSAPAAGTVLEIHAVVEQPVTEGDELLVLAP